MLKDFLTVAAGWIVGIVVVLSGLFVVSAQDGYGIYFFKPEHGAYGWAGADYNVYSKGMLRALDYQTGKLRWVFGKRHNAV